MLCFKAKCISHKSRQNAVAVADLDKTGTGKPYSCLFTRDPFQRLWSFYVDTVIGGTICGDPASFTRFFENWVFKGIERHTDPITTMWNPCRLHVDYVGTMETFTSDVTEILGHVGWEGLVQDMSHTEYQVHQVGA